MLYCVILIESDEGFAVGCPDLQGCWSQGSTPEEALEDIRDAIREVLGLKSAELSVRSVSLTEAEFEELDRRLEDYRAHPEEC